MATWRKPHTLKPDFSKQNLPDFPATKFFDQLSFVGWHAHSSPVHGTR